LWRLDMRTDGAGLNVSSHLRPMLETPNLGDMLRC
jgi:hypothetical protein